MYLFDTKKLLERTEALYPGFRIVDKNRWWLTKALALVVNIFNPRFMTHYITTIHDIMAYPKWIDASMEIFGFSGFCHERVHMGQWYRWRFWYDVLYLFPQSLAPLALLSCLAIWWGPWYLLWLIALVFLLPWPAPWRAWWEAQAFVVEFKVRELAGFKVTRALLEKLVSEEFASWAYYHMMPRYVALWLLKGFLEGRFRNPYLAYALRDFNGCAIKNS